MARFYKIVFRSSGPDCREITVKAQRNTRRAAERAARGSLRRDHGVDPTKFYRVSIEHVPE